MDSSRSPQNVMGHEQKRQSWIQKNLLFVWIRAVVIATAFLYRCTFLSFRFSFYSLLNFVVLICLGLSLFTSFQIFQASRDEDVIMVFGGKGHPKSSLVMTLLFGAYFLPVGFHSLFWRTFTSIFVELGDIGHTIAAWVIVLGFLLLGMILMPHLYLLDKKDKSITKISYLPFLVFLGKLRLHPIFGDKARWQDISSLRVIRTDFRTQGSNAYRGSNYSLVFREHKMEFEIDEDPAFWDNELIYLSNQTQRPITSSLVACINSKPSF